MLEHIFGSKTRLKLLYLFFNFPERDFYVREMARFSGLQLNAVRREIGNLEKLGLIAPVSAAEARTEEIGTERSKYYHLQKNFLLFNELRSLLIKAHLMEEQELISKIKERAGDVKFLLLTGVFTGESEAETDMLLVGKLKPLAVSRLIKELEKVVGRPLRYTLMDDKEYRERREIGDKFLYNLFEAKHLVVADEYKPNRG